MAKPRALTTRRLLLTLMVALMSLGLTAAGCSEQDKGESAEQEDSDQPPAQVDLPEPPPASAFEVQEKNDDGTFRVAGLIQYRDKYIDKPVRVKGIISRIEADCDPKKAKEEGTECPDPHFVIKDAPDAEKDMMVVGFKQEFVEEAELEPGQEHVYEGTYKKVAQGFVASEEGLILLDMVDDMSVLEEDK
ncbi:MAG: hypothetical protein ACQEVA_07625 [Myxococcota bacterium]